MAETNQDPLARLKLLATTYGIPPEVVDQVAGSTREILLGTIDRFLGVYIEHTAGAFPLWLAPEQVRILPVGEKFTDYAKKVSSMLHKKNVRVSISEANETLGKRIREAQLMKIPYVLVVGEKEQSSGTVAIRHATRGDEGQLELDVCVEKIQMAIAEKR